METETPSGQVKDRGLGRWYALSEAQRCQRREATVAAYRQRIINAAAVDPNKLSGLGQRILRWLSEDDDDTVAGIEELFVAARWAAVADDRTELAHKVDALRRSQAATEAAMVRYDERWGQPPTAAPARQGTDRFTMGLVVDVARVLEAHGYGPFDGGRPYVELQQHLLHLLHGEPGADCTGGRLGGAR